jgi:eukaryotic-like serine/threonine-protein kinase
VDATPAVADGTIFGLSRSGTLHAVDAANGEERWSFRTGGETRLDFWDFYLSDPLVHGGMVVFGSGDGRVYALDRESGELLWAFETGAPVHGAPVGDEDHIYVGGFDGVLYALKAESGEVSWTFQARGNEFFPRGEFQRGPALHDGVLYAGSRDYRLYAVRAKDGAPLWEKQEGDGWIIATPLATRDQLYFGASDGQRFYALDRGTGEVGWSTPVQTRVFGSAVEVGGSVVFGGFNGKLLAVDPLSGEVRWTFQTPASHRNFHRVYDESGQLNDEMRELYRSGKGLEAEERILTLGSIPGTPAVRGNTLFFGTTEGVLYAVEVREDG